MCCNLRYSRSGTEVQYSEKEALLTELLQLVREVGYKFKIRRNIAAQAERQTATHARDAASAAFSSTAEEETERMFLL